MIHTGLSPRFHALGVWTDWKPMLWFLKGERKERLLNWKDIPDVIYLKPLDKDNHPWTQSPVEAEYLIDQLTVSEDALVVDPFLGSGAFGLAAIKLGRYCIGVEIDKETSDHARNNLNVFRSCYHYHICMNVENKDDFRVVAFFTASVGRSESKRHMSKLRCKA